MRNSILVLGTLLASTTQNCHQLAVHKRPLREGHSQICGRVTSRQTGLPIKGATVSFDAGGVSRNPSQVPSAETDTQGHGCITNLLAGQSGGGYATAPRFKTQSYFRPPDRPYIDELISLGEKQIVREANFALHPEDPSNLPYQR